MNNEITKNLIDISLLKIDKFVAVKYKNIVIKRKFNEHKLLTPSIKLKPLIKTTIKKDEIKTLRV